MDMYRLNDYITVRDDVTMVTIDNVSDDRSVMGDILNQIVSMDMDVDIIDYHNSYKGSCLTLLVENSGILRVTSAVGMFKDRIKGILCNIYCLNTAVTVSGRRSPAEDASVIMNALQKNGIELCHLFSCAGGITAVINEAYTDRVCDVLKSVF